MKYAWTTNEAPNAANGSFSQAESDSVLLEQYKRIDVLMERFLLLHCGIAALLASIYSTWLITVPVTLASLLMFAVCRRMYPGTLMTRCMAGVSLQAFVALHIYQMHGLPEMHFFFFTAQTMMIFYYDWRAFWPGTILIIFQHILFAALTNAGYSVYFFPETYITLVKQFFHYSIAVGQVAVCAYWAQYIRRGFLKDLRHRLDLEETNSALGAEIEGRKTMEAQLEYQARHDPITGLANRTRFSLELRDAAQKVASNASQGYAVFFIDLDHFKLVNDTLGHDVGDELLVHVARRLEGALNDGVVARFGGDEFTAILPNCGCREIAGAAANDVLSVFEEPVELSGRTLSISASIGVAFAPTGLENISDVIRNADIALYQAKSRGRGRSVVFDDEMQRSIAEKVQTAAELRTAITNNELCLHFQPVVAVNDGSIEGFEALVRWNHPTRGLLNPGDFIPIAEEMGIIEKLGDWVLLDSCKTIRSWNDRFGDRKRFTMAINLSDREIHHRGLVKRIESVIEACGVRPTDIVLEISENAAIEGTAETINGLHRLHEMGCALHLDDFGTGQASLSSLLRLPVSAIKVDRSFVSGLFHARKNRDIFLALLRMADTMGLYVIAEGVETKDQVEFVRDLKCDFVQGMAFDMPLTIEQTESMLANRANYAHCIEALKRAA